jgi:hypothetical protein
MIKRLFGGQTWGLFWGFESWIQYWQDAHFKVGTRMHETWKHEISWC